MCESRSCLEVCAPPLSAHKRRVCVSVIEALKNNHKEELEREVEKVKRLSSGGIDAQTLQLQQK